MTARYNDGVVWMLRRGVIGAILFIGMVALTAWLWRTTPGSLVPDEDQGFYISAVILPDGATLERTDKVVTEVAKAIRSNPNNQDIIAFTGFDFIGGGFRNNAATIFVTQKPWDQRNGHRAAARRRAVRRRRRASRKRWCSRSIRRRSSASAPPAASSSTSRTAVTAAPSGWAR